MLLVLGASPNGPTTTMQMNYAKHIDIAMTALHIIMRWSVQRTSPYNSVCVLYFFGTSLFTDKLINSVHYFQQSLVHTHSLLIKLSKRVCLRLTTLINLCFVQLIEIQNIYKFDIYIYRYIVHVILLIWKTNSNRSHWIY